MKAPASALPSTATPLPRGATLNWSFKGSGSTMARFTASKLTNRLTLGKIRSATFSWLISPDALDEGDESFSLAFFFNPNRSLALAGTQFTLRDLHPTGLPSEGSDLLTGTTGDDLSNGAPPRAPFSLAMAAPTRSSETAAIQVRLVTPTWRPALTSTAGIPLR
jgi:hypothetical protein